MARAGPSSTFGSSTPCLEASKGKPRSTYFERYGAGFSRRESGSMGTDMKVDGTTLESGKQAYPDPRVTAVATSSLLRNTLPLPASKPSLPHHATRVRYSPRAAGQGLSIDATASRSVKVVPANVPTVASTLTPPPTPCPPSSPPAMLSPLEYTTSSAQELATPGLGDETGKSAVFGAPKVRRRVVIKESERTRRWAEEMLRYQGGPEISDAAQQVRRSAEKSPPRRETLPPVSTDLMDNFISELNPDAKVESPRFPPLTPLSPWQAYTDKARSSRSSSRQRSRRTALEDRKLASDIHQDLEKTSSEQQRLRVPTPFRRSPSLHRQSSVLSVSSIASATPLILDVIRTHSPSLRDPDHSPRQRIPTIDEIVKRHAGAAEAAQAAARKSIMSTHPSSTPTSAANSPLQSPSRPKILRSSSRAEAIVNIVPPRASSKSNRIARRRSTESIDSNVVASQALLEKLAAIEIDDVVPDDLPMPKNSRPSSSVLRSSSTKSSSPSFASSRRLSGMVQSDSPVPFVATPTDPATHSLALYIRSPRLTRIIKVPGSPPLSVSIADVGSAFGKPVFVFLGLGCVRYLIALFDDLAEALGLRLICVDRWGLGKTDDVPQDKRSLLDWARVVEHVADELGIEQFGLLAHSAGAPYALATALRLGSRIVGTIHLLSPWVSSDIDGGETRPLAPTNSPGYKWLKWVPNSVIKTAQAAEWRLQGWALGKPPPVTYNPIGFDASAPVSSDDYWSLTPPPKNGFEEKPLPGPDDSFDDLADFQGRFGPEQSRAEVLEIKKAPPALGKRVSKGFQGSFFKEHAKGAHGIEHGLGTPRSPITPKDFQGSRTQSEGSLASRVGSLRSSPSRSDRPPSALRQQSLGRLDFGLDEDFAAFAQDLQTSLQRSMSVSSRSSGRTTGSRKAKDRHLSSPILGHAIGLDGAAFGTALLQASHAESLTGGTADLMAILGRDSRPWGFSYTDIEQPCKIWYGSNDDKISEKSMRWCQRCMDAELIVLPGQGHNLMMSSRVMLDVLESLIVDDV